MALPNRNNIVEKPPEIKLKLHSHFFYVGQVQQELGYHRIQEAVSHGAASRFARIVR